MRVLRTQKWPLSDTIKFEITQIHFFRVTFFDLFSAVLPSSWLFMLLNVFMEDVLLSNSIGGPPLDFRPNWGPNGRKIFFGEDRTPPPSPPHLSYLKVWVRHWTVTFWNLFWNNFYLEHCHFFKKKGESQNQIKAPDCTGSIFVFCFMPCFGEKPSESETSESGFYWRQRNRNRQIGKSTWFKAPLKHATSF